MSMAESQRRGVARVDYSSRPLLCGVFTKGLFLKEKKKHFATTAPSSRPEVASNKHCYLLKVYSPSNPFDCVYIVAWIAALADV